jgi:hypothetical protein
LQTASTDDLGISEATYFRLNADMTGTKVAMSTSQYGDEGFGTVSGKRKSARDNVRQTELGVEKRCRCCKEFWPADEEFFFHHRNKLSSACKACLVVRRSVAPIVPDIDTVWRACVGHNVV